MLYSPAFSFSSGYPLGVLPCAGLRLGVLRQFQAFLASSACAACASSYHFSSIASPPWRSAFSRFAPVVNLGFPVLASGSNCAVKPTRLRRAAYFRSLGGKPTSGATVIRALLTLIAFLVTLPVIGVMTFFAVIFLAGPHGGVLPQWTEPVVLILGWSVVIVFPTLVARKVWLRTGKAK